MHIFALNLMVSTTGVSYANIVHGASTGDIFLDFFGQALHNVNMDGEPILRNGDCVVVDNCPTHHGRFGPVLRDYLAQQGIEVLYTPTYSPEFNPAEYAFNKIPYRYSGVTMIIQT
jgi:hypothetical protein